MSASYLNANATDLSDKSRRKNCSACVSSKRRCDKRTPRCSRCAEKNFSCIYQTPSSSAIASAAAAAATAAGADDHPPYAVDIEGGGVPMPPHSFDFNNLDDSHPVSASGTSIGSTLIMNAPAHTSAASALSSIGMDLDANMMFDFSSVFNANFTQDSNTQLWETQQAPIVSKPLAPELSQGVAICNKREEILVSTLSRSFRSSSTSLVSQASRMTQIAPLNASFFQLSIHFMHLCPSRYFQTPMPPPCRPITECTSQGGFQPWHIYEPGNRLGFLVSYFANLHTTFAQTKETPFLHRDLYRSLPSTPRPLIAAYTALSAYAGRTRANKAWAIRAVCEGADEILKLAEQTAAASLSVTKSHEKLACVQALWLLQTVRCFDGDVSLRAAAVRDMGVLNKWLKDMEQLRDNLDDLHLLDHIALRQKPPRSWEVWIFNECVRRTVFLGHLFTSLFEILVAAGDNSEYPPNLRILDSKFDSCYMPDLYN